MGVNSSGKISDIIFACFDGEAVVVRIRLLIPPLWHPSLVEKYGPVPASRVRRSG